jgi:hypothetical protein
MQATRETAHSFRKSTAQRPPDHLKKNCPIDFSAALSAGGLPASVGGAATGSLPVGRWGFKALCAEVQVRVLLNHQWQLLASPVRAGRSVLALSLRPGAAAARRGGTAGSRNQGRQGGAPQRDGALVRCAAPPWAEVLFPLVQRFWLSDVSDF